MDLLLVGFLKACGLLLIKALTSIAAASLWLEYFPSQLQASKVIEIVICRRITEATESQGLLLETQMDNRPYRSTELAVKLVVDATHTV